jgi:hypothetical protein
MDEETLQLRGKKQGDGVQPAMKVGLRACTGQAHELDQALQQKGAHKLQDVVHNLDEARKVKVPPKRTNARVKFDVP